MRQAVLARVGACCMYYVARCVMHGRKQAQHCELLLAKVAEAKERAAAGFACIRVAIALVHYSLRCSTKQGRAERSCTLLHPSLAVRHSTPNTLAYSRPRAPGARVALACALMLVICFVSSRTTAVVHRRQAHAACRMDTSHTIAQDDTHDTTGAQTTAALPTGVRCACTAR